MITLLAIVLAQASGPHDPPATDDPAAVALANRTIRAYQALHSLQCLLLGKDVRAEFVWRRDAGGLIRRLGPYGDDPVAEFRVVGNEVTAWSVANRTRYLRMRVEDLDPAETPFVTFEGMARLGEPYLAVRLETTPPWVSTQWTGVTEPTRVTFQGQLRLGARTTAADGTAIDTLIAEPEPIRYPPGASPHVIHTPRWARYQIGVEDGLIRRVERGLRGSDRADEAWEVRDVRANADVPDAALAFRPPPGRKPAEGPPSRIRSNATGEEFLAIEKAMSRFDRLFFRSEWRRDAVRFEDGKSRRDGHDEATSRFALGPGLRGDGELAWREAGFPVRLRVESDGRTVTVRQDDGPTWDAVPVGTGEGLWSFGGHPLASNEAEGATLLVREFAVAHSGAGWSPSLEGYRLVAPVREEGETLDVLEWRFVAVDDDGIPTGVRSVKRLFVGHGDRIPRRYEAVDERDGSRAHVVERFFDTKGT